MPTQLPKGIEERFDEKLLKVVSDGGFLADVEEDYEPIDFDTNSIKSFLATILSERDEKLVGEIRGMKMENTKEKLTSDWFYGYGFNNACTDIINLIKNIK